MQKFDSDVRVLSRGHLNDLNQGLTQQMFFWGRDVLTAGNLLLKHGFRKRPSPGLQGTSCYYCEWQNGLVELHGACVGWYPHSPELAGFLFIRADRRCYNHHETSPTIPGRYDYGKLKSGDLKNLTHAGRIFASWLAQYERWVFKEMGPDYRRECYTMNAHLPASNPWLKPDAALHWITLLATADPTLPRARNWNLRSTTRAQSTQTCRRVFGQGSSNRPPFCQ